MLNLFFFFLMPEKSILELFNNSVMWLKDLKLLDLAILLNFIFMI